MMQHPLQALRPPLGSASRLRAVLIASLVVLGQVSGSAHLLFSRHAICLEHGEIIHLDEEISSATPVAPVAKSRSAASVASSADVRSAEYSHDHCLLVSQRRERATLSPPQISLCAASLSVGVSLPQDVPRPPWVALFRLAPKNSPPA